MLRFPIDIGIGPDNLLFDSDSMVKLVSPPYSLGMEPVKELFAKFNDLMLFILAKIRGSEPLKLLLVKSRNARNLRLMKEEGITPFKELLYKSRVDSKASSEICVGKKPTNFILRKEIVVTLPFTLQPTPHQEQ